MSYCAKCGIHYDSELRFCTQCATPLTADPAPAAGPELCSACGAALSPGLKFCTGCGKPAQAEAPPAAPVANGCSKCGARLEPGLKFCIQCGAAVDALVAPVAPRPVVPVVAAVQTPPAPTALPVKPAAAAAPPVAPATPAPQPPKAAPVAAPKKAPEPSAAIPLIASPIPPPEQPPIASSARSRGPLVGIGIAAAAVLLLAVLGYAGYRKFATHAPAVPAPTAAAEQAQAPTEATPLPAGNNQQPAAQPANASRNGKQPAGTPQSYAAPVPYQQNPAPEQRQAYVPPPSPGGGQMVWTGNLADGQTLSFNGTTASSGHLEGALPGVPVWVEVEPDWLGVAEPPSAGSQWRRMTVRPRRSGVSKVIIRWHRF